MKVWNILNKGENTSVTFGSNICIRYPKLFFEQISVLTETFTFKLNRKKNCRLPYMRKNLLPLVNKVKYLEKTRKIMEENHIKALLKVYFLAFTARSLVFYAYL